MTRATRRNFTKSDKAAMNRRATDANGQLRCEGCGLALKQKQAEYDHIIPEALRTDEEKKRKLTPADGQVLGRDCCHRGPGSKTSEDMGKIAKAKRNEAKAMVIEETTPIPKRPFAISKKTEKRKNRAASAKTLPPRHLYRKV